MSATLGYPVPAPFNVRVAALPDGYRAAVLRAIDNFHIDHASHHGEFWVCRCDLEDFAGPGSDISDPGGGCYIPPDARFDWLVEPL